MVMRLHKGYLKTLMALLLGGGASVVHAEQRSAEDWQLRISAESFYHSDAYGLGGLTNHLGGDFKPGETLISRSRLETKLQRGRVQIGAFYRQDYLMEFSKDVSLMLYQDEQGLPYTPGKTYELALDSIAFRGRGVFLGYRVEREGYWIEPRFNLIQGQLVHDGVVSGTMSISEAGDIAEVESLALDNYYFEDLFFDREVVEPTGQGASIDLAMGWQASDRLDLTLSIRDLLSRIHWSNTPRTQATGSTNRVTVDANGRIHAAALLSGIESYEEYKQTLPVEALLVSSWRVLPQSSVRAQLYQIDEHSFWGLGWDQQLWATGPQLSLDWNLSADAFGVSLGYRGWQLSLSSDSTTLDDVHTFSIGLAGAITF